MPCSPAAASWISSGVTTLLLRSGFGLRTGTTTRLRSLVVVPVLVPLFLHYARHVHHQVAGGEVHDFHALRVAAGDADPLDRDADHDALLGDHHQLVVWQHFLERDDVAGLGAALQGDDAAAAAVLNPVLLQLGALAHAFLRHHEQRGLAAHHDHVDHVILLVELDPLHARRGPPHVPDVFLVKADAHTVVRGEDDVVLAVGHLHVDQLVALLDVDGANAVRAWIPEFRQHRLLHDAVLGREHEVLILGELAHRDQRGEPLVGFHRHAVDDRLAARGARRLRDLVHLEPVALALFREEHQVVVGRRDEQVLDPVVFLGVRADHALPAAPLAPIGGHRQPLDVARVRDGDHHVFFGDQILDREVALVRHDLGAALVAEAVRQLGQLLLEDLHAAGLRAEDVLAVLDEAPDVLQLLVELGDLEGGEPRQPHVEDFGRLLLRELEPLAQRRVGRRRVFRLLDDADHLVDVVDGDLEALENVLAVLRPLQLELGAPHDHDVAVLDEVEQDFLEVQLLRHAVHQGQHDGAEGRLHLRVRVQLIEHDHRDDVAPQLDDEPDPLAVGFVADVADPFELLREHEVADLLVDALGAHLVREFADDDLLLAGGLRLLGDGARPQHDAAASLLVALLDAVAAVDDAARREIGTLDEFAQVLDLTVRIVHEVRDRLHDFAEIVRGDVRRHAHRDARRAIDDQVREAGGEDGRFLQTVVEVGDEDNGVLVDVLQHRHRGAREPGLGVAVGCRRVAFHGAKIPLPIDERVAQREVLHLSHQRVVQRHV